jgi:hypothetical protein
MERPSNLPSPDTNPKYTLAKFGYNLDQHPQRKVLAERLKPILNQGDKDLIKQASNIYTDSTVKYLAKGEPASLSDASGIRLAIAIDFAQQLEAVTKNNPEGKKHISSDAKTFFVLDLQPRFNDELSMSEILQMSEGPDMAELHEEIQQILEEKNDGVVFSRAPLNPSLQEYLGQSSR